MRFVLLRDFYAENDVDQCVVSATQTAPRGGRAQVAGLTSRGRTASRTQLDKKKTRKRAPFQAKGIPLESPSKTTQEDGLGLRFHARFLFFSRSDVSDDERISRCPLTCSRRLQHGNRPFLDRIGR